MEFNNVTIIGGGTLGSQIGFMSAFHNKNVTIWGRSAQSIDRTKARIARWETAVQTDLNATDEQIKNAEKHLQFTTDLKDALAGADLVIEALPENVVTKDDFYAQFKDLADPNTILVTNTSTFLPSQFAEATGRPGKFLAYHFANEIWKFNTAEIMPQSKTNPALPAELQRYSKEIGMIPIMINQEQPGYILNSLLVPFLNNALILWSKGIASPEDIDNTWTIGTGAPSGPFRIMDTVGMKTIYEIAHNSSDPDLQAAAEKVKAMIDAGKIGRESGEGFYKYN
ncbi:3-hydroxyacyl-CoA dehydrogenase [Fructilactobacillus carniphilus]|uniref:3-hydroxyacyl-CoA dehydrogenase n=1 Tax=Fructilactobacillus carniphilus TaxID=2940297 RepID=A0ABY5BU99_9LACO|nr:3-hydroxyacyl-CoA dehydrogenase [Fructilactobacillus carniphilus]USS90081.1 3-hydroxyacyl-CoA dehydrogenase [Fructilactobacillus carniphilus]